MKQAALAEVIGVSPQQYQKYEDAQSKCSITNLFKLADFLGVDVSTILPVKLNDYGEPTELAVVGRVSERASAPPLHPANETDLLGRMVSAFIAIADPSVRERLVDLTESLTQMQHTHALSIIDDGSADIESEGPVGTAGD